MEIKDVDALYLYAYTARGDAVAAQVPVLFDEPVEFFEAIAYKGDDCPCVATTEEGAGEILAMAEEIGIDPDEVEKARKRAARWHSSRHVCK